MSRYLLIDVGAGTMDVLLFDDEADLHYKGVVKSPVRLVAEQAAALPGNLLVEGGEMGGGPLTRVLSERAATGAKVVMTRSAAATIHHDLERVRGKGIEVIDHREAKAFREDKSFQVLRLSDVDAQRIALMVHSFGLPFELDVIAVCVQDHGVPPAGISHLDHRHRLFSERLGQAPYPHRLLFSPAEIPDTLNRCRCAAADVTAFAGGAEVFVMDSGMAAILGASTDALCQSKRHVMVLDVATSHTVGAAFDGDDLTGFFEYHTKDITPAKLDRLLVQLADGALDHKQVLSEGGHGAFNSRACGFSNVEVIVATGPRRSLVAESSLPNMQLGAPLGDNMMTGTAGLLTAIRRRSGQGLGADSKAATPR